MPYQTFATSDGHIIVAAGNDRQYQKLVAAGDAPELASDPRFLTNPLRVQHRDVLVPLLVEMVAKKTRDEWITLLETAGVPCGPINNLDEVFDNPQVVSRGLRVDLPHPSGATAKLVGSPMRLSATPPTYPAAPPLLGQHTGAILRDVLNYSDDQIQTLRSQGIV